METVTIILILAPILLPVLEPLGVDPIHFGMIMVIGAEIGMLTPPVGVNLFVASSISNLPIAKLDKAIIPFVLCMVVAYLVIVLFPPNFPAVRQVDELTEGAKVRDLHIEENRPNLIF